MPKTREQIITDMCYTQRHDYRIQTEQHRYFIDVLLLTLTDQKRKMIRNVMEQLFNNGYDDYCLEIANTGQKLWKY